MKRGILNARTFRPWNMKYHDVPDGYDTGNFYETVDYITPGMKTMPQVIDSMNKFGETVSFWSRFATWLGTVLGTEMFFYYFYNVLNYIPWVGGLFRAFF